MGIPELDSKQCSYLRGGLEIFNIEDVFYYRAVLPASYRGNYFCTNCSIFWTKCNNQHQERRGQTTAQAAGPSLSATQSKERGEKKKTARLTLPPVTLIRLKHVKTQIVNTNYILFK